MKSSSLHGAFRLAAWLLLAIGIAFSLPAHAHKASDAYLQLQRTDDGVALRWDIALRDLDAVLDLDSNADQKLSWGEVRARLPDIEAYALSHLRLQQGRCAPTPAEPAAVEQRVDGAYLVLQLRAACAELSPLELDYRLFQEVDPTHRGLLRIASAAGESPGLRSLDPTAGPVSVAWPGEATAAAPSTGAPTPAVRADDNDNSFFRDGVHHIVVGYDHVLFLICLLLPSVLRRTPGGWVPVAHWREAAWSMVGTVTMFTVAHSITLALAGLKLVSLSPRIVEPGIALTIIVAALNNFFPLLGGRHRLFTFLFGLIHGFGFASVLAELDLPASGFVLALLEFNLGVEAGQLIIVTLALGLLLALRFWRRYPPVVLQGGSAIAVVMAGLWFTERVFDLKLMPF